MEVFKYPVFFECQTLDPSQKNKIKRYFGIQRKSGGGDCGPVESVGDKVYKIAFIDQTVQERVLQKPNHVLGMPGGPLSLTLRDSLEPPPTTTSSVSRQECHHSLPVETSPPGGGENVLHRLSTGKQEKINTTCHLEQSKLRLLEEVIEKDLGEVVPGVKVTRGDSAQLVLQGNANEVQTARQLVTDKISLVLERVVPEVSLHLLSFLREEYGRPGNLSSLLGLGHHVEVELGDTELRLFSLSSGELDQAEKNLLGEFGEEKIDVPKGTLLAELKSKLEKKVKEMNQSRRRVVARYGPGCRVQLLGHMNQVQELREEIGAFLMDRSSVGYVRRHQQNQDGVVSKAGTGSTQEEMVTSANYRLRLGLQVVVRQGDITKEQADALVNAANEDLDHAGGVAAALSQAGGPEVQQASRDLVRQIGRVPTGTVVETTGGNLPCKILLHAVGPVGRGGNERLLLEKTVKAALDLAETMELQTLAMPCISSGIFGIPLKVCSEAIVSAVRDFGREPRIVTKVTLIDVSGEAVRAMQEACDRLLQGKRDFSGWEGESSSSTTTTHAPQRDTTAASTRGAAAPEVCVQVEVIQGTIEKQQVDALVSPMVGSDPLSSRVGNALSEAAGPGLMTAFLRESGGRTAPGDNVLVEELSGLSSGRVFFLRCAHWDNNPQGPAVQALRQGVRKILTSCENRGFCSVAFPVVGTGEVLQFPHNVVTQVLLEEIHWYEQNRASRSPFLVRIVVHPNDRDSTKALQTTQNALHLRGLVLGAQSEQYRIVLLGKTGGGKSSAGNTILGQDDVFLVDSSSTSATQICEAHTKNIKGRNITLIDTPGLFDTDIPEEELKPKIVKCITECSPGPHAFLIVLKVERYTVHENEAIEKIETYFSPEAFKYATVLFTHGDQLNGLTIEKFVQQNDELNKLVEKCGGRYHVIDNKYWNTNQHNRSSNQYQVAELLNTIEKMVRENGGGCYTNEMLQEAERLIQAEMESLRKELKGQMSQEEMRQQAKERARQKLLIKLSGIATGAVVGALLGVALVIGIPLPFTTKPLVNLVKRQMAASMTIGPAVVTKAVRPVLAAENGVTMGVGSKIGAGVGIAAGVVFGMAATAGASRGGIIGAAASEEAETVQEAAEKAANAVYKDAKGLYDQAGHLLLRYSNSK